MAGELQTFGNDIAVAQASAPRAIQGSIAQDLVGAAVGGASTFKTIKDGIDRRKLAEEEARTNDAIAQGFIAQEKFKQSHVLAGALERGELTPAQAENFGKDEQAAFDALQQAAGQGMSRSIKNSLMNSVMFQNAVAKSPGSAKEFAAAFNIGNGKGEFDTLAAVTKIKRDNLQKDADGVRELMDNEGYTEHIGASNEEVIEMWLDSPAAKRQLEIKQSERRALSEETSIKERAPHASRAMALGIDTALRGLDDLAANFAEATGSSNTGSDGRTISLAEQQDLYINGLVSEYSAKYPDFPKNVAEFANGLRAAANSRVEARKKGIDQGILENRAQVLVPMEVQQRRQDLIRSRHSNSQNPIDALSRAFRFTEELAKSEIATAKVRDEIREQGAFNVPYLAALMEDPGTAQRLAQNVAVSEEGTLLLQDLVDPVASKAKRAGNEAVGTLSILARNGDISNIDAKVKGVVQAIKSGYDLNEALSPSKNAALKETILQAASDPAIVKLAKIDPEIRAIIKPYSDGIRDNILKDMRRTMDSATKDKVSSVLTGNLPGSSENPIALWRKLGQYMQLDAVGTNKAGVPQYKLVNNIEEALETGDIVNLGSALEYHNNKVLESADPRQYELLKNLTGSTSIANGLNTVINSDQGSDLATLSLGRRIPDRDQAAIDKSTDALNQFVKP